MSCTYTRMHEYPSQTYSGANETDSYEPESLSLATDTLQVPKTLMIFLALVTKTIYPCYCLLTKPTFILYILLSDLTPTLVEQANE